MATHTLKNRNRSITVYQDTVRDTFAFLKQTSRLDELYTRSIVLPENDGYLLPICELHLDDAHLLEQLARWREQNIFAFPTQFPVTLKGTSAWLRRLVLETEDRILFLVVNKTGYAVGHLGFANALDDQATMEIDNVVRGETSDHGIMSKAVRGLIAWAEEFFSPKAIHLRVFSDNDRAIKFYHQLNFENDRLLPLRRFVKGEMTQYVALEANDRIPPDKSFLTMVYKSSSTPFIPNSMILTAGPSISARETSYAYDAARTGWNNNWSGYLKRFENSFADYVGVKYALPVASCTGALHISLVALGIGPGDEVIVPDLTWVATANAVAYTGATPVFAEVEPDSWCLDADSFESLITERTKAVIPVHLYGHPANMSKIMAIANQHNLFVIEDAAPALGAEFEGKCVGSFGHFSAFSFQGAKLLVSGEGGMLLTDDKELYEKAYKIWHLGSVNGTFWIDRLGWKYKLSNVQAAIGLGQLEHVDQMIEDKRRIFNWYVEGLADLSQIKLSSEQPWARSIYWMSSFELDENIGITRDELREELKRRYIDTRPVFPAISQYPYWKVKQATQPIACRIGNQGINLPSGVRLRREQVDYIIHSVRKILDSSLVK